MLRLLLYRGANKILELDNNKFQIIDVFIDEEEKIKYLTSYSLSEKDKIGHTDGMYLYGVQCDILMFYVENKIPKIRYNNKEYDLTDKRLTFNCYQYNDKEWVLECLSPEGGFRFVYKPYFCDPYDDDIRETNFGLWLISILQNPEELKRVIKVNSPPHR